MCFVMRGVKAKECEEALICPLILSVVSVFQTRFQHSIFRDRRSQLSLAKEVFHTSPVSKSAPSKAPKEDFSATVRSREAHGTMVALLLCHRELGHAGSGMGAVLPQPADYPRLIESPQHQGIHKDH